MDLSKLRIYTYRGKAISRREYEEIAQAKKFCVVHGPECMELHEPVAAWMHKEDGAVLVETGTPFSVDMDERKRKLMENYKKIWRHRAGVLWRLVGRPCATAAVTTSPVWIGGGTGMLLNGAKFIKCVNERVANGYALSDRLQAICREEVTHPAQARLLGALAGCFVLAPLCVLWVNLGDKITTLFDQIKREWDGPLSDEEAAKMVKEIK